MKCNIALCGPEHSGKSTLAGYIKTIKLTDEELERKDIGIRENLGSLYSLADRFAYYVDTAGEHKKDPNTYGTSKVPHPQILDLSNGLKVGLIDSPGANKKWKDRYQTIAWGEVAVIVFELRTFEELYSKMGKMPRFMREREKKLTSLYLWKNYKKSDNLIIVISKMDGNDHDKDEYDKRIYDKLAFLNAMTIINMDSDFNEVPIIPISIDIKNRKEHNVYTRSSEMPWYTGNTLMEEVKLKAKPFLNQHEDDFSYVFASIERRMRIRETQEPAFRIKLYNGILRKRDRVRITQVSSSKKLPFSDGEAIIKSMKIESGELVNSFEKGDLGGVTLSKIEIDGSAVNASDVKVSRASYIIDKNLEVKTGNLLFFKSRRTDADFSDMCLLDKINLLMFGKIISTSLVAKNVANGVGYVCVFAKNYPITLPILQDGQLPLPNYVIEKANLDFMPVELYDLKHLTDGVSYNLKVRCCGEKVEPQLFEKYFGKRIVNFEEKDGYVFPVKIQNIEQMASKLRAFFRENGINDFSAVLEE